MKIEAGKTYVNGRGDACGPMDERTPGVFLDQHGAVYHPDGKEWNHTDASTANLVALVNSPLPAAETADAVRNAAEKLLAKLDFVHDHPAYKSVWEISQMRLGPYTGPNYVNEVAALRSAMLAAAPSAPAGESMADEERAMLQLIDERDAAEECLSQMYYLVTGNSPEWSNFFGHEQALEYVSDALALLKKSAMA